MTAPDRPSPEQQLAEVIEGHVGHTWSGLTDDLAAALTGRDAVLIDLDHRNTALAKQRIGQQARITAERLDGNTVTWTVDPELPGTKGEHPDQLSMFEENAS